MSSTNRGAVRVALNAYHTPDRVARACLSTIAAELAGASVLEPHAGAGAFVRAAVGVGAGIVYANDINPIAPGFVQAAARFAEPVDFLATTFERRYDWVTGNPPFDEAEAHIRRAHAACRVGVGFLLRLAILEGEKRRALWTQLPPSDIYTLVQRPAFLELYEDGTLGPLRKRTKIGELVYDKRGRVKLAGTDSAAYAWFVWRRGGPQVAPRMHWLDWAGAR